MADNLKKGEIATLEHSKFVIGLGWDTEIINTTDATYKWFKRVFIKKAFIYDFEIDASVFILGENKKMLCEEYFVFYNNLKTPDCSVELKSDFIEHDDDKERIIVDLVKINANATEIRILLSIYNAIQLRQNFGQVRNPFVRIYNPDNNDEILKYELREIFSNETVVELGRIFRCNGGWKFEAVGIGHKDGLQYFVDKYVNF